jgi:hypothetical protein
MTRKQGIASPDAEFASGAGDVPLPHNVEAERSILGAFLLDNHALDSAVDESLRIEDFFLPQHRKIFEHMARLSEKQQGIDMVTLMEELDLSGPGELEAAGGAGYLSQLADGLPRITNVPHYVRIVKDAAMRRLAMFRAQAIIVAGYDREDIAEIKQMFARAASTIQVPEERVTVVTGKELLKIDVKPREFLIDGLITSRSMNEIFAWRGLGKTWAALSMGHAVASGGNFLRWQASRPRQVLFVDGELDAASLQHRLKLLEASDEKLKFLCADMQEEPFPNLATARAQRMVEDAIDDAELLILDNLSALAPSSNETEGEDWIRIQMWLLELRRRGIATVFLHHAGHAGWSRGTTRREDLLDIVVELRRPKDYVATEGLRFEMHFTKTRGMLGASAGPIEARLTTDLDGRLTWTCRDLEDARLAQIVDLRSGGSSWREIESATGIPRSTAERIWRNAQQK